MNRTLTKAFRFLFYPFVQYMDSRFHHLDLRCDQLLQAVQDRRATDQTASMDRLLPILLDNISRQNAASGEAVRVALELQGRLEDVGVDLQRRLEDVGVDQLLPILRDSISSQNAAARQAVRMQVEIQNRLDEVRSKLDQAPSRDDP